MPALMSLDSLNTISGSMRGSEKREVWTVGDADNSLTVVSNMSPQIGA